MLTIFYRNTAIWLAYTDLNHEGSYVDITTGLYPWWTYFKEGSEPNGDMRENCVEYTVAGNWIDRSCSTLNGVLCEKLKRKTIGYIDAKYRLERNATTKYNKIPSKLGHLDVCNVKH